MTSLPPGATALTASAVSYLLGICALVVPGETGLPTPCAEWDLGMLLAHLSGSMADLETAIRTGRLDLDPGSARPPGLGIGDPVELIRERAARLLCAVYGYADPGRFVVVGGVPMPAGLVACTGAVEVAVHGWDVSAALGAARPVPAALATRMLRLCPLLVAGREGLFGVPVEVPPEASPGDRLVGYLGRDPAAPVLVTGE